MRGQRAIALGDALIALRAETDVAFGIELTTDSAGLPAYGGKGTFVSHVDMSNGGLMGDGTFKYLKGLPAGGKRIQRLGASD